MSTLKTPFRYDFVGSFLRPQILKDSKKKLKNGEIQKDEYDKIVNEEITKLVAKQKKLGFHAITDGEFRRTFWHLDFMWGFEGVEHEDTGNGVKFDAELAKLDDTYLVGKIKAKAHPFVEYFKFLKQFEDENTVAKYTIPAPAQTFQQFIVPNNIEGTRKFYADNDELIKDIAAAYSDVIKQFYDAGCRNLQLDDCTWGAVVGDAAAQRYQSLGIDIETVKEQLLKVNNLALENKPADMVITSHICRGNYHSTYFTSGAYDPVADYVFARENVDALLLEYDDERSGGFEPLAKKYTFQFKLSMVELYLSSEVSYQELALSQGISNPSLIVKWVNDFRIAGPDALRPKKKGRKKTLDIRECKKPSKYDGEKPVDTSAEHVKELEDELLKLRIENAYLKELRRLRLEEETLLKKQRELSTVSEDSSN